MSDPLAAAVTARDADEAARIFMEQHQASAINADARVLSALSTLCAKNRHNEAAHLAYAHGKEAFGPRALRGAGLNFNALLYACCRDQAMLDKALAVWEDMKEQAVPGENEPLGKLMLSCLARSRYDDAFAVFLDAIDAGLQPGAQVCAALLRTCGVAPRLAQAAYAVFVSMRGAGLEAPAEVLLTLLRGCTKKGTLEQAFEVFDAVGGAGGKIGRLTATDSCEAETPRSLATADVTTADVRLRAIASASAAPPLCATVIRASTWSRLVETTVTELAPSSDTSAVSAAPSGSERTTVSSRELLLERARRARCRSCRRSRIIIIMRPLEAVELVATVTMQSGDVSRHAACTSATMVAVSFCELVAVTVIVHSCVRVTLTSAAPLPLALACATAIARRLAATSLELSEASSVGSCTSMLKANEIGGNGGGE